MPNITNSLELVRNMGLRYVGYRLTHLIKVKSGYYLRKFPISPRRREYILLEEWKNKRPLFWKKRGIKSSETEKLLNHIEVISPSCFEGKFRFFNANYVDLGDSYDWITNPETGFKYDSNQHWSLINDYDSKAGDIKFVWEKSRFSFIYDIIRYDEWSGNDNSYWVWKEILSWIEANPVNGGPNYKCSQEISLRVLAWTSALYYYSDSKYLTTEVFSEIQHVLYWQLKHVFDHIDFSRIAVRNNHAITETLTLFICGQIYSDFPNAKNWSKKGKKWLEEEISYQIYDDGTFLQFSMNYHRVVIQLLSLAFSFVQLNGETFSDQVYSRAYSSLNFLFICQNKKNGFLPNYGSNDGALFFPLSSCSYRDFRPQLNALHLILTGKQLYDMGPHSEEAYWWQAKELSFNKYTPISTVPGWKVFPRGGYAILTESDGLTFIRCGSHKDRPAQADNLHVDIWSGGENILHDAGSYKYNTSPELVSWFMGTKGHNTVMIDSHDQMLKGPRFIWFNWSQCDSLEVFENEESYIFTGIISAFQFLNKEIKHKRTITKSKTHGLWIISDEILNKPVGLDMIQIWHPTFKELNLTAISDNRELKGVWKQGWSSEFYGIKRETEYLQFRTQNNLITTTIRL